MTPSDYEATIAAEPWLTKRELARRLRCSTRTIERLDLPAMRVGGQNRYRVSEVEAHLRGEQRRAELVVFPGIRGSEPAA
jgi:excisionase family DNA binding protein